MLCSLIASFGAVSNVLAFLEHALNEKAIIKQINIKIGLYSFILYPPMD
jgi:hypothetical protein